MNIMKIMKMHKIMKIMIDYALNMMKYSKKIMP